MSQPIARLAQRIRDELDEIARVVQRAQQAWDRAQSSGDDLYLDSVALNLHAFYDGVEGLFEAISSTVDAARPTSADWHRALLNQMATEASGLRPAVVSDATRLGLDEYRSFRHVVRHLYPFRFEVDRIRPLVERVEQVFHELRAELLAFAAFLHDRADHSEGERGSDA